MNCESRNDNLKNLQLHTKNNEKPRKQIKCNELKCYEKQRYRVLKAIKTHKKADKRDLLDCSNKSNKLESRVKRKQKEINIIKKELKKLGMEEDLKRQNWDDHIKKKGGMIKNKREE